MLRVEVHIVRILKLVDEIEFWYHMLVGSWLCLLPGDLLCSGGVWSGGHILDQIWRFFSLFVCGTGLVWFSLIV